MRNVQQVGDGFQQQQYGNFQMQSGQQSPPMSPMQSGTQQQQQQPQVSQATQYRVARIQEHVHDSDVSRHDEFVFNLRDSPPGSPSYTGGSVRVMQVYIGDGPETDVVREIRTIVEECPDDAEMHTILLDSGADAAVFPCSLAGVGVPSEAPTSRLHDAQGVAIPVLGMRDVEVHLMDMQGRTVVIQETVALSDRIKQPILCFGRLFEGGWGLNGVQQTLEHASGVQIPVEMQNRSMSVRGWIRVIQSDPEPIEAGCVRAVKAEVTTDLTDVRYGWKLNAEGVGTGRHLGDTFQDPTAVVPSMSGSKYRTTLIQDGDNWLVMELCEPLNSMVDMTAQFHDYAGNREILTIITDAEKAPQVMGFRMLSDVELQRAEREAEMDDVAPLAQEDELQGVDIDGQVEVQGQEIPIGHVVHAPGRGDHLLVNGVEIFKDSAHAVLKTACNHYGISSSGSKLKCFQRLWDYQSKLELQTVLSVAREAEAEQSRQPRAVNLAEPPSEEEQQRHALTHLPYKNWCAACVAHRARQDRHVRSGAARDGSAPTISFDYCYTRAVAQGENPRDIDAVVALVVVDSNTNYLRCIPLKSKTQYDLMVKEIISFTQTLGHSEVVYMCDNEPNIKQVQKMVVQARLAMGLPTRSSAPGAYTHGNSLCENSVGRVRGLACSLMHDVQTKLSVTLSSNNGLWSWAFRHACWLLNRYGVVNGATPYELVYGKLYDGRICQFSEPVFAYCKTPHKGNSKWQRMLCLGKVEAQDTFILYNGLSIVLSRSIRRISTDWKAHLSYFLHFNAPTWNFKAGFGGRVIPTRRTPEPAAISGAAPSGPIMDSPWFDKDAHDVRRKAIEEDKEEREAKGMASEDANVLQRPKKVTIQESQMMQGGQPVPVQSGPSSSSRPPRPEPIAVPDAVLSSVDDGDDFVPTTPPRGDESPVQIPVPPTPRQLHPTRAHGEALDEGHEAKKARVEAQKRQKINQIRALYESRINMVEFGDEAYHTMDEYEVEQLQEEVEEDDEVWSSEDEVKLVGVPDELWSDASLDSPPSDPERWIDELAEKVEVERLLQMGVLQKMEEYEGAITGKLTTKFVFDWRQKLFKPDPASKQEPFMRWMRRARYVAREFATTKRLDTYSPATGTHTANILPVIFLERIAAAATATDSNSYQTTLASLDIKDAFLQVPQAEVVQVALHGQQYAVRKNLPGQRLGAKAWFMFFKEYVSSVFDLEWCKEQPVLAREKTGKFMFMIHVDDLLFVGDTECWKSHFLPKMQEKFSVSFNEMKGPGSSIMFLKRKMVMLPDGMMIVPGTSVEKVISCFEGHFGQAKQQQVPCDASIQQEDVSQDLNARDSTAYRSVVGLLLYLSRDRMDLIFSLKELASKMSRPTLCALQRLRKLVGYLKSTGDMGVRLFYPNPGEGRWKHDDEKFWLIESFTDADWSSNKAHRRSTSCAIHCINKNFAYGSARTQRVISLSSCESELHSIVSGCCDGMFMKKCLEFLVQREVKHVLHTDSSSARQLISRQGSGKIRHLSGKILWVQEKVQQKEIEVCQIPTAWNVSDIGTKSLTKARMRFLLHELGAADPETGELLGQEEFQVVSEGLMGAQEVKRVAKAVLRMSVFWGLGPNGAAGEDVSDTCKVDSSNANGVIFWLWAAFVTLLVLMIAMGCILFFVLKKLRKDLTSCWNQVADEDVYIDTQEKRIDALVKRTNALDAADERMSNEHSQLHDYVCGIHYAVVEQGGFVRHFLGLTSRDWTQLSLVERANLATFNIMGSSQYLQLVRQRAQYEHAHAGDNTDPAAEHGESEEMEQDEAEPGTEPGAESGTNDQAVSRSRLTELAEVLKGEQTKAMTENRVQDGLILQHSILEMLDEMRGEQNTLTTYGKCLSIVEQTFLWLETVSRRRGQEMIAEGYADLAAHYRA